MLNPNALKGGGVQQLPNSFRLGTQKCTAKGKIALGIFNFILFLHFSEKISNLPPTPGVG